MKFTQGNVISSEYTINEYAHNIPRENVKSIQEYLHNAQRQNVKSIHRYNKDPVTQHSIHNSLKHSSIV
jgi:hypothetical protein